MKEKTFKDLGLDEGEKNVKDLLSKFNFDELEDLINNEENKVEKKK